MNRLVVRAVALGLLLSFAGTAPAAGDWLQRGRELLNSFRGTPAAKDLGSAEIADGLRDALRVGTDNVVSRLGAADGFNADPAIHIPLPETLRKVRDVLEKVGMSGSLDDLELKMNRAAEAAAPKAKTLFADAIAGMTIDDAKGIFNGPDDAATRYFQAKMSAPLAQEMTPVVAGSLAEVGAVQRYDEIMARYQAIPFVPDVKANLTEHVVDRGIDAVFHYLAAEEAAIRRDPVKRTTAVLKKVFGTR
ncbi:MAG: DUF4197 domain-containing protein [Gammaproteobacteria bacterium]|nr:DUF4197 domain-containing protein [Gammaproteobacteria bacterium]